jgi:hypothetical protein
VNLERNCLQGCRQGGQVSFSLLVARRVLLGRRLAHGANVTVSGAHTKVGQQRQTLKGDCDAMGRCIAWSSVIRTVSGAPRSTRQNAGTAQSPPEIAAEG